MPIVSHLKEGFDANKPRAWHRNEERLARGLPPVHNPAIPLDGWERELVWMEICMLSGCNQASFHHLARAWGRDKGFHMALSRYICGHQGNMQRENHMRRQNESRKSKGPIIMNPGSTDLEPQQAKVLDHCNLDSLIGDTSIPFDPTVGYQAPPEPIQHSAGKRGKRNPMFCPVIEPEAENDAPMPAPAPFHHIPQAMSPPHVIPFNPPIQAMQHQNMYGLQTRIAQAPIGMMMPNMMDHRRKMISHEALILEENNMMHQQV
eukprot:CAMPEP_0202471310 /NCGR_PEP_ID=MMETSP1360-20130828/84307_1 /ASSEMBLY_ACC=CAM_ASM_000848 /TAXON_ID=515479 /ORGANISM="Licmophora paradoxa, Strain CCMP2313" /LENGTH=261 /DNA_ID=CAMNT_0049097355 /DNA_START=377 /DNA_END=1162 /DNA_ORIENTATION=-